MGGWREQKQFYAFVMVKDDSGRHAVVLSVTGMTVNCMHVCVMNC